MSDRQVESVGSPAIAPVIYRNQTAFEMTLQGMRMPVLGHAFFNGLAAAGIWILGHHLIAVVAFVASCSVDVIQQTLLKRWLATSNGSNAAKDYRKLAILCVGRVIGYTVPTFIMAMGGGLAEFALFSLQSTTLMMVAMGSGGLSRSVFWALSLPLILEFGALSVILLSPVAAAAVILGLLILAIIAALLSEGLLKALASWHVSYQANLSLVDDLAAARDQAIADRAAADAAREAARSADSAKSNFLATMSHEIRTPMNGVLGMAQLMKRDAVDPTQAQRLDVLIDSGEYLLSILNDILDVSKIDAGKLELVTAPESLRDLFQGLVRFWGPRAEEKGLTLRLTIGPDTPTAVLLDARRLRQVLFNLIGNALKFTEAGSVEITTDARYLSHDQVELLISVRDTGHGIAEQHLDRLFERFSQVEDADVRRFGGTGLGLAIVKQLVELMQGQVSVESMIGEGSTFHICLPLHVTEEEEAVVIPEAAPDNELGLKVLAVDDNAVNLMVIEQLLTSLGHDVVRACNGEEALAALATEPFDLLLTDIQMPRISGIEVLRRLRAVPGPNRDIPAVALTADVTSGGRQHYLDQGFTDYSAKPIQLTDLLGAMARALDAPPPEAIKDVA